MFGSLWQRTKGEFRWKCAKLKTCRGPDRQQVRLLTSSILFGSTLKDLSVQRWPFHYLIKPSGVYSVKWLNTRSCFTSRALKRITLDHVSPSGPNPVGLRQKVVFLSLQRNDAEVWEISTVYTARSIYTEPEPATLTFIPSLSAATRPAEQECKKNNMVKPPCFAAINSVHPDCKLS